MTTEKMKWSDVERLFKLAMESLAPSPIDAEAYSYAAYWARKEGEADSDIDTGVTKGEVVGRLRKKKAHAQGELSEIERCCPEMMDYEEGPHTKHMTVIWWCDVAGSFLVYGDHWGKDSLEFLETLGGAW